MNELTAEKLYTTKEVAGQLGTSPKVILENARKCLPNKVIENGKPTYWSKAEVMALVEQLKCNQVNGRTFPNLSVELKGLERCERDSSITTMQFAKQLGTSPNVVLENARKCLPKKKIENGKSTYWTKEEVTILLDYMKSHTSNNRSAEFSSLVANTSTELTPALKIKKALELMQEGYEEELERLRILNAEKERRLQEQTPKVEFFDKVTGSSDTCDMKEVAKILNFKGVGRNKLFEILRNEKVLDRQNQPYQQYVDSGYFRVIESKWEDKDGDIHINLKTVVFQSGVDLIRKVLMKTSIL